MTSPMASHARLRGGSGGGCLNEPPFLKDFVLTVKHLRNHPINPRFNVYSRNTLCKTIRTGLCQCRAQVIAAILFKKNFLIMLDTLADNPWDSVWNDHVSYMVFSRDRIALKYVERVLLPGDAFLASHPLRNPPAAHRTVRGEGQCSDNTLSDPRPKQLRDVT